MNWRRLLCLIGEHKPVLVTELPEKTIVSGGLPLSISFDHPGGEAQFKGKVVCLWCGKGLKATIELHRLEEEKEMSEELIEIIKQMKREHLEISFFLGMIIGAPIWTIIKFIWTGRFDWEILLFTEVIAWSILARERIVFEVKRMKGKETEDW